MDMTDPHITAECSLSAEEIASLELSDASADFGPGAVVLECRCGSWVIEDEDGTLLAWSTPAKVAELYRELSGAA